MPADGPGERPGPPADDLDAPPRPPEPGERGLVGNAGALLGSRLVKAVLGWAGTVLIARTLSLEDFGVFSLVFTVLGLMSIVTEFGIGRLAVRGMTVGPDGRAPDPGFPGSYLALRTVLGVLGYLVAVGAVAVAGYSGEVVQATAVAGVVVLLATPSAALDVVFQARMRLGTVAAAETTAILGQVGLTAAIAAAGGSLLLFTLPAVLFQVIVLCWKAQVARRLVSLRPRVDLPGWRAMLREAIPLSIGFGLATAYGKLDSLLLSKIVGFEAVGIYGISYKFVDLMEFAATAVTVPLLALLVRYLPDDRTAARAEFRRAGLLLGMLAGAAVVGLVGFAEPLTRTLYGADYAAGADTTKVLAIAQVFNFVIALAVCGLIALEQHRSYPVMMAAGLAVNLGLNAWLIPAYSYLGAGYATLVSNALVAAVAWWLLQRTIVLPVSGVPTCLLGVGLGLTAAWLLDAVLPWPVAAALAVLVYAAVVSVFGLPARAGLPWPPRRSLRGAVPGDTGGPHVAPTLLAVAGTGQVSGAERVLVRAVEATRADGWRVVCAVPPGPLTERLAEAGAEVVELPELGLAAGSRPVALVRTLARAVRGARVMRRASKGVDVVLLNAWSALPAARLAWPRRRPRPAPAVAWLAHDVLVRGDRFKVFRLCRGVLTRMLAVSEAVALPLRGDPPSTVVHNGVPWPVAPAPDPSPDRPRVVGINALLSPWKGHPVLLEAAERLPDDVVVEVMGGHLAKDGGYAAELRDAVESSPRLRGRVRLLGHVADPLEQMRGWTVAVSASVEPEACPLNVLEAMSIGVPVVATDHGGSPEVLDGSGVLVPPGDAAALADALTALLDDPDRRAECARLGRERVARAHRLDRQTERLVYELARLAGYERSAPVIGDVPHERPPMRVLFVNENIGGHTTVHAHLRRALNGHPEVRAEFIDVPRPSFARRVLGARVPGLARLDADLQPVRAQLALSAWVRRHLVGRLDGIDVLHVYTANAGLRSVPEIAALPSVVSTDATNETNAYRLPSRPPTRLTPYSVRLIKRWERPVYDAATLVTPSTEWVAESLRSSYGVPEDRLRVMPFGIVGPDFGPGPAPGTGTPRDGALPQLVFVGRGLERKGGLRLLRLHQQHLADRCELVLVTPDRPPPRGRNVRVEGNVTVESGGVWPILRAGAVFVFPSLIDQAPNVVLEAQAAGLPVVGLRQGAMVKMVPAHTGVLVDVGDDDGLVAILNRLIDDPELRAGLGAAGRQWFLDTYDVAVTVPAMVAVLREAFERHHAPERRS